MTARRKCEKLFTYLCSFCGREDEGREPLLATFASSDTPNRYPEKKRPQGRRKGGRTLRVGESVAPNREEEEEGWTSSTTATTLSFAPPNNHNMKR
ncbi:hypothetical protein AGDE_16461 [Angomonas deanei]|uniref:Uncharacterized protein n=1 Tax=Angomonas deanei TaxID=59799 RepID=A0A7G2CQ50_9TRYP|nr:hypothetical protein AGDE_16461 [Angomonas deanei]CAD2220673.1 hypothetical protein, conserved [Angomonas deanei]|eukprot:EPY17044.1 hypothetical protein AGDE_16461 [Angomonas deanei]